MATIRPEPQSVTSPPGQLLPALEPGDHLDQTTFHARYEAMPPSTQAELVLGVVYLRFRVGFDHGSHHAALTGWMGMYHAYTPGTLGLSRATVILGPEDEAQPDTCLLIAPELGGQTGIINGYVAGAPELVAEVATSSAAYDLFEKRTAYERAGVREYIVLVLQPRRLIWLVLEDRRFIELAPGCDGLLRSTVFPGLWLDPEAMVRDDSSRVLAVLQQGLASPEHAAFVAKLNPKKEP